jgi:hypothetical protein
MMMMIDIATFEEDSNQLYQRAFADNELIFHNPLKNRTLCKSLTHLRKALENS